MYHVINNYQSAYIKRRQLGINARTIHDNINKSMYSNLNTFTNLDFFFFYNKNDSKIHVYDNNQYNKLYLDNKSKN